MATEIAKKMKDAMSMVRAHSDAVARARDIYLATIKRAEADYFERITRAGELVAESSVTGEPPTVEPAPTETAPQEAPTVQ